MKNIFIKLRELVNTRFSKLFEWCGTLPFWVSTAIYGVIGTLVVGFALWGTFMLMNSLVGMFVVMGSLFLWVWGACRISY